MISGTIQPGGGLAVEGSLPQHGHVQTEEIPSEARVMAAEAILMEYGITMLKGIMSQDGVMTGEETLPEAALLTLLPQCGIMLREVSLPEDGVTMAGGNLPEDGSMMVEEILSVDGAKSFNLSTGCSQAAGCRSDCEAAESESDKTSSACQRS